MSLPFARNLPSTGDDVAGAPSSVLAVANGPDQNLDKNNVNDGAWFHPEEIAGLNWDQRFPYQLLVLDRQDDGTYRRRGSWKYTLPIPPESLTVTTPFAITTTVTQGGIVEEHNAAPLRQIEIAGSTGVLPPRPFPGQPPRSGLVQAIFAGTIAAAGRTAASARQLGGDLGADQTRPTNLIPDNLLADQNSQDTLLKNTGYWQARMMTRFIEAYANLKRTAPGRNVVLALACWKDEAVYLVTPNRVQIRKAADSPMEYRYQVSMTGWGRVRLEGPGAQRSEVLVPDPNDPNVLAKVHNALQDVRRTLESARATVTAVVGDVDAAIFEPVREAILAVKVALSIPVAMIDLPASIIRDAADTIVSAIAAGEDVLDLGDTLNQASAAAKKSVQRDLQRIREALAPGVRDRTTVSTGLGNAATATASPLRASGQAATPQRPALDIFDRPDQHADLLGALRPDRLKMPQALTLRIKAEVARVTAFTKGDLAQRRDGLRATAAAFEDLVGAGDATFAQTFGRRPPRAAQPLSTRNFKVAATVDRAAGAYSDLIARGPATADEAMRKGLEAFATRAVASGIPFKVPRGKFPVPFQYGDTLEQVAQRYLGSPARVPEIVALNGLRAPYVDEVGVRMALLAPAAGREVVVADSLDLFVGQHAWLEANDRPPVRRRILAVARHDGQARVTLDGAEDLDVFSPVRNAMLHVFLPGTVNSQSLIFIPSDQAPTGTFRVAGIADARVFDPLISAGGVDLLLTPSNDLVVTPDGDGRWAVGLANIVQQFRILVQLRRGELLDHPDRGLGVRPGESVADLPASDVAKGIRDALSVEPSFGVVRAVSVDVRPPSITIAASVEVAGTGIVLPLSVDAL